MPRKNRPMPRPGHERIEKRAIAAWPHLLALVLVGAGAALAALCPWPAGITLAPFCGILALTCWIEVRRASRVAALAAEWQRLLAPYLPALPALVSQLREAASQLERAVLQACDGFHGIGVKARAVAGSHDQRLDREILRVVVALQFQDIVNQRIEHAIETLTELGEDLGSCLKQMPPHPEAQSKLKAGWTSRLGRVYTTIEAERRLPSRHNGAVKSPPQKEATGNIEIFPPEVGP